MGQLGEGTADAVPEEWEGEAEHAPSYYRGMEVDFWFRLWDRRRLVADDTRGGDRGALSTADHLLPDRPLSLYRGTRIVFVRSQDIGLSRCERGSPASA